MSVAITLVGGLGNQLFQIACAYAYSLRYNKKLELTLKSSRGSYFDTILQACKVYYIKKHTSDMYQYKEPSFRYNLIPKYDNVRLCGHFQSEKYFIDYKSEIIKLFKQELPLHLKDKYTDLLNRTNVVVLHARRTDYLIHAKVHIPLTLDYYSLAINKMEELLKQDVVDQSKTKCDLGGDMGNLGSPSLYLLISDDNQYLNYLINEIPVLKERSLILSESDVDTFLLAQSFQHFIIANSTFSWWIAYLAQTPKSHVIAPKTWFGPNGPSRGLSRHSVKGHTNTNTNTKDLYLDSWIKL